MKVVEFDTGRQAFARLRAFAQRGATEMERCELCHSAVAPRHPHLLKLEGRRLICSCDACALLFSGGAASKFLRLSSRIERLENFRISDAEWESLGIPINLAFFIKNARDGTVSARYPSPGGATESWLTRETWESLVAAHPLLQCLEPEVQALLVNRVGEGKGPTTGEYYLAPIDLCYQLVGLIRKHWRGFSGGTEVWQEVETFFSRLRSGDDSAGE